MSFDTQATPRESKVAQAITIGLNPACCQNQSLWSSATPCSSLPNVSQNRSKAHNLKDFVQYFSEWLQNDHKKYCMIHKQQILQKPLFCPQFDCQPGTTTSSNNISTPHSSDDYSHYLGRNSHVLIIVTNTYATEPVAATVMSLLEHTLHILLVD